ncbi:hypothetical protein IFM89_036598 [Coptis chinensis]|uniref:Mitochondrial import inner membrane translocase subunit n=1 Tax=Coptis chinensis TaxID=261450 RepID=A0A835HEY7_9MAGN|nr:hypothetical protein IFM89_036598 [Coptis chinensis]
MNGIDMEGFSEEEQKKLFNMIEQQQVRDSLRMYNSVVERCFTDCVESFRRKSLDKQEESCVTRCTQKFLAHTQRVNMRFAELSQGAATPD